MSDIDDLLEKNGASFVRVEGNAGPSEIHTLCYVNAYLWFIVPMLSP